MSGPNAHYPTIMKLKTVESEIELLLNGYDTVHKTYNQNMIDRDYVTSAKNLAELQQISNALLTAAKKGRELLNRAVTEGEINQQIVAAQKPRLDRIIRQAESQRAIAARKQAELLDAEAELEVTSLSQKSNWLQYVITLIVGLIVAGLTVKTITSQDVSALDNAILAIVFGLLVYILIKKLM